MHNVLQGLNRIHRDRVFFNTLFGSIFDLAITVPSHGEHYVLHLCRREERSGLELQSLAHGEELASVAQFSWSSDGWGNYSTIRYCPETKSRASSPALESAQNSKNVCRFAAQRRPGITKRESRKQNDVAAVNRTRGSCMASTNFTTKPLRQMIG